MDASVRVVHRQPRDDGVGVPPQRPVSLYDNLKNGGLNGLYGDAGSGSLVGGGGLGGATTASSVGNLHSVTLHQPSLERARTPSQANCLSTTVPQNIAPPGFSSRHAPTRSSLRHSRMIVMTREGKVPRKYQPGVLRCRRLATALSALVALLGALITAVAVWLLLWAPNLPARDIPVYSGPPLLAAGLTGLILLGCCRKDYPGRPYSCCVFSFKVLSVALSSLAALAALCASAFALLHLLTLWGSTCEPAGRLNATCTCEPDSGWAAAVPAARHVYKDLNCPEVESLLSVLLTGSGAANGLAGLLAGWYVLLHWTRRYASVYARVRTAEANPVVIANTKA